MATRYAVANGNWSSVGTWDGGTTLPGAGDLVYADGKTVTIDQTVNVGSIRTDKRSGGTAGGVFNLPDIQTFTANIVSGTTTCLVITAVGSLTITGNIIGSTTAAVTAAVCSSACDLTVIGDITGCRFAGGGNDIYGLRVAGPGNFTCSGTITGGGNYAAVQYRHGVLLSNAVNVSLNNVTGGTGTPGYANSYGIYINATGNITVSSNITTVSNAAIYVNSSSFGTLTLNGNSTISAGQTAYNIYCNGTGTYDVICNGICEAIYAGHTNGQFVSNQGATGVYTGTSMNLLTMTKGTHGIKSHNTVSGWTGLTLGGSGVFTYVGDITASATSGHGLQINGNINVNITGNVINNTNTIGTHGINYTGGGDINVTGDIIGLSSGLSTVYNAHGINYTGSGNIIVNGNIIGSNSTNGTGSGCSGLYTTSGNNITVNGNVYTDISGTGFNKVIGATISGKLLVTGNVTCYAALNAIYGNFNEVQINGVITQFGGAINAVHILNNPSLVTIKSTPILQNTGQTVHINGNGYTDIVCDAEVLGISSFATSGTVTALNATYMCGNQFNVGLTLVLPNVTEIRGHLTIIKTGLVLVGNGNFNFSSVVKSQGGSSGINATGKVNLTITGNIINNATSNTCHAINLSGDGDVTINGNITNTATASYNSGVVLSGNNNVVVNGDIIGGTGLSTLTNCNAISMGNGNLTINGNVTGGTTVSGNYYNAAVMSTGTCTINNLTVTGNIQAGLGSNYNAGIRVNAITGSIHVGGFIKSGSNSTSKGIETVSATLVPTDITVNGVCQVLSSLTYTIYIIGTNSGCITNILSNQCEGVYILSQGGEFNSPNAIPVGTTIASNTINIKSGDIQDHATVPFYGLEIVGGTGDITINGNVKTRYGGTALNVTANRNVIINGDILVYNTISGNHGFTYSGKGNVTVTGSIYACQTPSAITVAFGLYVRTTSIGDITINGDIIGCLSTGGGAWNNGCNGLWIEGSNNVYIHGTVTGGKTGYSNGIIVNSSFSGNITCYSNVYGYKGSAIYVYSGAYIVNISGDNLILPTDSGVPVYMGAVGSKLNVVGDYLFKSGTTATYIYMGAGTLLNFIGNMYGPASNDTSHTNRIIDALSATINFTGNIIANASQNTNGFIYLYANTATATINFTGNILMGSVAAKGIVLSMASTVYPAICNVTGNVYAGTGNNTYGIYSVGAIILDLIGEVKSSPTSAAVYSSHVNSINRIRGNYTVVGGIEPCYGSELTKWLIDDTAPQAMSLTTITGSQRFFSTSNLGTGIPQPSDVRYPVTFGTYNEYTGTLRVPSPDNVALNIPIDDTVGTAILTKQDMENLIALITGNILQGFLNH